jgi:hypothetical protein
MAEFRLSATATVPDESTLRVTVIEFDGDTGSVVNHDSVPVADGSDEYTLSGFEGTPGNEVAIQTEHTNSAITAAASLQRAAVETDPTTSEPSSTGIVWQTSEGVVDATSGVVQTN